MTIYTREELVALFGDPASSSEGSENNTRLSSTKQEKCTMDSKADIPRTCSRNDTINSESPSCVFSFLEAVKEFDSINREALASIATKLANKTAIPTTQFGFGTYNIVLRIKFEDESPSWMCRVPRRGVHFEESNDEMEAESLATTISTMMYVAENTSIPVPRIFGYCLTADNIAETPYIFMEDFQNTVSLADVGDKWNDEDIEQVIYAWGYYTMELARLQFPQIGMLHLNMEEDLFGSSPEIKRCLTPSNLTSGTDKLRGNRGPYQSTSDYLLAISDFKKSIYYNAPSYNWQNRSPSAHRSMLRSYIQSCQLDSLIPYFVDRKYQHGPFVLSHYDFNTQNILVDPKQPGKMIAVIDWDFSAVVPVQSLFRIPKSLTYDINPDDHERPQEFKDFAKKWRQVYCNALISANEYLDLDFPAERLLKEGTLFGNLVEALKFRQHEIAYYPKLFKHLYGCPPDECSLVESARYSDWAMNFLQEHDLQIGGDGDQTSAEVSHKYFSVNVRIGRYSVVVKFSFRAFRRKKKAQNAEKPQAEQQRRSLWINKVAGRWHKK